MVFSIFQILYLSFERYNIEPNFQEEDYVFLSLTTTLIPLNASSAAADLKCCPKPIQLNPLSLRFDILWFRL